MKVYAVGFIGEIVVRLVETDVTVMAKAEKLKVCRSHLVEQLVVSCTCGIAVCDRSVRHIGVLHGNIDAAEKMLIHEIAVALVVGSVEALYSSRFTVVTREKSRSPLSYMETSLS